MNHILLVILFALLLLPGIFLALIPMLPAFWFLMAIALIFGLVDGFVHLSVVNLAVLGALFFASILVDWSAGLLGAKFGGAAWKSLLFGGVGALIGVLFLPPFGLFLGLFIGVLIGELLRKRTHMQAVHAASGALIGSIMGVVFNVILACTFLALFVLFALF